MTAVPEVVTAEAVDAAADAIISHMGRVTRLITNREHARYVASLALVAGAPLMQSALTEHIAAMVRRGEQPFAGMWDEAVAAGRDDERERIIGLASQLRAAIPADHPPGAQASFADYLRVARVS